MQSDRRISDEIGCPPGILALDYMVDFARQYNDAFIKVCGFEIVWLIMVLHLTLFRVEFIPTL